MLAADWTEGQRQGKREMTVAVRRGVEFTGYMIVRHKACKTARRVNVGTGWFAGWAPDGESSRYDWDYDGCGWRTDLYGLKYLVTTCPACARGLMVDYGQPIYGRYVEEIVCNAKCMGAVGPSCDCSCGGQNHGGKWG